MGEWANGQAGERANGRADERASARVGRWAGGRVWEWAGSPVGVWCVRARVSGRVGESATQETVPNALTTDCNGLQPCRRAFAVANSKYTTGLLVHE
eukprot:8744704-Alexandrium_andersonii.AAC.1